MRQRLGEILKNMGVVTDTALQYALIRQEQWGHRIGRCLIDMRQCTEEDIVRGLSAQLRLPAVCIGSRHIPDSLRNIIPADVARELRVIPIAVVPGKPRATLRVAMAHPWDPSALDELGRITRYRITVLIAGDLDLAGALQRYYPTDDASPSPPVAEQRDTVDAEVTPFVEPVPAWDDLTLERDRK